MPELQLDVANRFISSLSKSLQALCHGCMEFDSGIEIVGYINVNIDSGSKVDYVLNEKVLKSTTKSLSFVSNSFLAKKESQKQIRDGACSPIPHLSAISSYSSGAHNSSQYYRTGSHVSPHSQVPGGSQKRPGTDDWRNSPKRHRSQNPHMGMQPFSDQNSQSHPQSFPSSSHNYSDTSFKHPQGPATTNNPNSTLQLQINIKKEALESDNQNAADSEHSVFDQSADDQTHDSSHDGVKKINIKWDSDVDQSDTGETADSNNATANEKTDFKGTFLDPSSSSDMLPSDDKSRQQVLDASLPPFDENSETDCREEQGLTDDTSVANVRTANLDESEAGMSGDNEAGCDAAVEYDHAAEEGSYSQSANEDAGKGVTDAGQLEVIEMDNEDEDVQAMFGNTQMTTPTGSRPRRFTSDQARLLFKTVLDNSDSDLSDCVEDSDSESSVSARGDWENNNDSGSSSTEVSDDEYQDGRSTTKHKRKQTVENKDTSGGKKSLQASVEPEAPLPSSSTATWHDVSEGETNPEFEFHPPRYHLKPELYQLQTPMDFLKVFFNDDIVECLVQNINEYAEKVLMQNTPKRKHSCLLSWTPLTKYEWLKFTSVIISMGLDQRPYIKDYWSTTAHFNTPWYTTMFSRNRFESIYHTMLHVCEPDAEGANKIEPLVEMILKKFQAAFYPFENVSIGEMVIGWQGRFQHKQYNANKPHKYHIKAFGLCDSVTGYVVNLKMYYGRNTAYIKELDSTYAHAVKVFATLLNALKPGHHIFADRFYTSKALIDFLHSNNFNYTGTLNVNQVGFPPELKCLRLQHQEMKWFLEGDRILCVSWRDQKAKKPCTFVSTKSVVGTVETGMKKLVNKPKMIHDYNMAMKGCNSLDQMVGYYNMLDRKTNNWWKTIYYWIFEIAQVNAHILHTICQTQNGGKKLSLKEFKQSLLESAHHEAAQINPECATLRLPKNIKKSVAGNYVERVTGARHLIEYVGVGRECVLCSTRVKRHRSSYACSGCTNRPHLCPRVCFSAYHK